TGFGKAFLQLPDKKITVEIKSLNSKGIDLNVRMPQAYREMELGVRTKITQALERGKIDFSIYVENTTEQTPAKLNVPVVKAYVAQLREVNPTGDETELLKMAVRMPEALKTDREDIEAEDWDSIQGVVDQALENIKKFRVSEGA